MGEYYSWKSASIATKQHMVGVFTIEQAPSPLPALYATDIRPKEEVISFPFDIPPRYHHLLVFLARLCRLQTLSKWLFQILVALFLFQLQKAYFPRSKFHAQFLTLRFPIFSSFLFWKDYFCYSSFPHRILKRDDFSWVFPHWILWRDDSFTSFTHLNLWKAGFTWVAELPEEKDKHMRSNIQNRRQLQLQLSTYRWFNFPSLDCHYFQYLPSILNFNIDNIHDINITWK